MAYASFSFPFKDLLLEGVTAQQAIGLLEANDVFTFPQLESGLFPAANFDNLEHDETGMADAWLRDSACVGLALLKSGRRDAASRAATATIACLESIVDRLNEIIANGHAPEDDTLRPPVRFTGQQSVPQYEWANAQNDALGYGLLFIGESVKEGLIADNESLRPIIDLLINYLETIAYWQDEDSGHWEEVIKLNASSVGTVVAGLRAVRDITQDAVKLEALIARGDEALRAILPFESRTLGKEREFDAAQLFLVEPQQVLSGDQAAEVIKGVEQALMGDHGIRRYNGDSYWGPDYREHFQLGSRAIDFSNPKNMELRDYYLNSDDEAQWTLFDPMLALYYIHQFEKTNSDHDKVRADMFVARSLMSVITHEKPNSETVWRIPESFFKENDEWVPNDHLGLLWSQANLLLCLSEYKKVFGEQVINQLP